MSSLIEDDALIGDGQTAALVDTTGPIDWLCWPQFDASLMPSIGTVNPTLTIIANALRVADHITLDLRRSLRDEKEHRPAGAVGIPQELRARRRTSLYRPRARP